MNRLFEAALEFQRFAEGRGWPFCFIGGLAVVRWGAPRMTQDVDVSLWTGFGDEEPYVESLLSEFDGRIADAREFALANRTLLLWSSSRVAFDVSLSALPFERDMIERASPFQYGEDCRLVTCAAEDLVALKAFADRSQDWADAEGVVARQGRRLDADRILDRLAPLCEAKGAPEIVDRLRVLLA